VKSETLARLSNEIDHARAKFPAPDGLTAALAEEIGEWAGEPDQEKARAELIQVACVAIRLYEEGDPLHTRPQTQHLLEFLSLTEHSARVALSEMCGPKAAERSVST